MFVAKKSILVSKPPNQVPNCWFHVTDEVGYLNQLGRVGHERFLVFQNEPIETSSSIPSFDLEVTKSLTERTLKLCESVRNVNSEEDEWETKILKYGWTSKQVKLFESIVKILDDDKLARLAYTGDKRFEGVQRRNLIDKSAERMRRCLAATSWDTQTVQWIHNLLMEFPPPSYLAAYLDSMQALKSKLPSLVDKMIFWKTGNVNQELLAPILKRPWQPALINKYRKLPGNALLVVIPSAAPRLTAQSSRAQKLYTLFTTMAPMLPVQLGLNNGASQRQSLQSISEQMVATTRTKIQELKAENPDRRLILVGMNSASALALQVALVEDVSGVVCFGFSYNTVHGVRGQPDDHVLDVTCPILFLIGQNAARSNEEEIEYFREKLTAPTTICTVGLADDYLRVSKKKRRLEGVTQEMVDNMVVDEIADFATKCLQRPQPQRARTILNPVPRRDIDSFIGAVRKRKPSAEIEKGVVKSQKLMRPTSTSDEMLDLAVQSILPDPEDRIPAVKIPSQLKMTQKIISGKRRIVPGIVKLPRVVEAKSQAQTRYITIGAGGSRLNPSTSQFAISKTPVTQQSFGTTKDTIVRSSGPEITGNIAYVSDSPELAATNIFDMPVVFADDEDTGHVSDRWVISIASGDTPTDVGKQVTIRSKNKNILIQRPAPSGSKMVMINGTVIGKQVPASNIVLPKAQLTKLAPATKIAKANPPMSATHSGRKIEILNNTIIKSANICGPTHTRIQSGGFVNLADGKPIAGRVSLPIASSSSAKNQIVIKSDSLKPYTGAQIIPTQIGSNKQLGNLTVKRLNVLPFTKVLRRE